MTSNVSGRIVDELNSCISQVYQPVEEINVTASYYDTWAENGGSDYETLLNKDIYKGPAIAAQAVADFFPKARRANVKVLDFAAGTGFVGENLKRHGFKDIDALDPSDGMLKKAKEKGIYNGIICAYLDDKKLPLLEDTYDCAVTSGGMGDGHIPWYGMDELIRIVKPGGLVCIVMREVLASQGQYDGTLEPYMEKLVKQRLWERVSRTVEPEYCLHHNGLVFKFKVLPSKYKK